MERKYGSVVYSRMPNGGRKVERSGKIQYSIEELSTMIDDIEDFDELNTFFRSLPGSIEGTKRSYSTEDLVRYVDNVREGRHRIYTITRTGGLRSKVRELLERGKGFK